MDKIFYRSLLPLVNDKAQYSTLQEYAKARIEIMHSLLETAKDHHRILEIQGCIAELKRFETLRDEALEGAK